MAGAVEALSELFGYNRGNFMFDRKLRQEREYMEQDMRVKQFELYREDVRDLTDLTVSKMDSYLMVALLEIGCCLDLLVEGVIRGAEEGSPPPTWLLWMYTISLAEAMLYLFLSSWLAIHASVSCHSFSVRLLTQYVRLPVPNTRQLDAATARGADFEGAGLRELVRVPVWRQQLDRLNAVEPGGDAVAHSGSAAGLIELSNSNPAVALEHVRLYRDLQANWQAHDAYARACLCIGTYTFLHAVAYYSIGLLVVQCRSPWAGLGCTLMLPCLAWLLIRLDLYFSTYSQVAQSLLLVTGPFLAGIAATLLLTSNVQMFQNVHYILVPIIFLQHILLIVAIAMVARAEQFPDGNIALPTRFRTVLYLDVFGWLDGPEAQNMAASQQTAANDDAPEDRGSSGLHPRTREALVSRIQLVVEMLRRELNAWEGAPNQDNLRRMPGLAAEIRALRAQVAHELERLDVVEPQVGAATPGEDAPGAAEGGADQRAGPDLWLRFDHGDQSGSAAEMSYFVRPDTGAAQIEAPEYGALVSDIPGIRERLDDLRSSVAALQGPARPQQVSAASAEAPLPGRPGSSNDQPQGSQGSDGAAASRAIATPEPTTTTSPPGASRSGGTISAQAQERQFGGREAARHEDMRNWADQQTFYPRRDGRQESRRPPGQVPWFTFLAASTVLVCVWLVGVGYYTIKPIIDFAEGRSGNETVPELEAHPARLLTGVERVLAREDWSHRPVPPQPIGLACHRSLRSAALIAERFAVREISLGVPELPGGGLAEPQHPHLVKDVEHCLSRVPDFHAEGFAGISLECSEAGDHCSVLLLGAKGHHALRCQLTSRAAVAEHKQGLHGEAADMVALEPDSHNSDADSRSPDIGGWRLLAATPAAGADRLAGGAARWWAFPSRRPSAAGRASLPQEPAPLRVQRGVAGVFATPRGGPEQRGRRAASMPLPALRQAPAATAAAVVAVGSNASLVHGGGAVARATMHPVLFDVSASGRSLRVWRVLPGAAAAGPQRPARAPEALVLENWRLPASRRWTSACATDDSIYIAADGGEVWRFDQPQSFSDHDPDRASYHEEALTV